MRLSDVHRRLADLIERVETSDVRVTAASPDGSTTDGTVTAELTVELSVTGDASLGTTEGDAETAGDPNRGDPEGTGTAATATEPAARPPEPPAEDDGGPTDGEPVASEESEPAAEPEAESESVPCKHDDCDATFETPHGMKIHYTKTHVGSDAAVPAYRDPEQLRAAYLEHETLTGVKEALDADVAVTTIRRHLLEHGIHDPGTATDGSATGEAVDDEVGIDAEEPTDLDEDSETDETEVDPVFDSDTEVAPGVTVDTFRQALHGAATVSGVQRALDLDRETTVELLREYDLLDVVGGRVASKPDHDTVRAEVDDRLRSRLTA